MIAALLVALLLVAVKLLRMEFRPSPARRLWLHRHRHGLL